MFGSLRRLLPLSLLLVIGLGIPVLRMAEPAEAVISTDLVISQIYGAGGNSGALLDRDYVELFNRGSSAVSLSGLSVQYASATGTGNFSVVASLPGTTLQPGQYFLLAHSAAGANGAAIPTPDATGTLTMAAGAGKVALVNGTAGLGCNGSSTPCDAAQLALIKDLAGFGNANFFEGASAAPTISTTLADFRGTNGCTDTDNNGADFATGAPAPRNTASTFAPCGGPVVDAAPAVSSTTPANAATGVAANANITVTFSEAVNVLDPFYTITCTTSGAHLGAQSGGTTTYTIDPAADFTAGESCTLVVDATKVSDVDANDPPENMAANVTVTFTIAAAASCASPYTPIYQIQGNGAAAAITGIVTTQGVVVGDFEGATSVGIQGFYLQDSTGDGFAETSDGIFVYTGNNASVVSAGQTVRVTGFARERFNQTAINGANDNNAAVTNILNCNLPGSIAPVDVTLPFATADFPERYEGMLVRLPQELVISEYFNYERFGEMVLALPLSGEDRPYTGTAIDEPGAAANARTVANSLSRITLDDGLGVQNPPTLRHPNGDPFSLSNRFRGGDIIENTVGVLGYDFSLYRIQPTADAEYTAVNPRPATPENVGGSLKVAAMNTLNFFLTLDTTTSSTSGPCGASQTLDCRGADNIAPDEAPEFNRQRTKLLQALAGLDADVLGLNEIENTPGVEPLANIVSGLNALPGVGPYDYIDTGVLGTDAIRVGLIYRSDVVTPVGDFAVLTTSVDPRFLDNKNRPALAQTFEEIATGARFTVAVNHLKSKGSDCNDVGDPDLGDGQGNCSGTRELAAQALVDWLAGDPTGSGDPDFLIMGDLNSYAKEDAIDAVKAGPDDTLGTADDYTNLIALYEGTYAYSYVFDGQFGYLDHALANASLLGQVTGATEWHINADEPDLLDYDTSFKPAEQEAIFEFNQYRTSDHDAVVIGLNLTPPTPVDTDADGVPDNIDNCDRAANPNQADSDNDGKGNACDADGLVPAACAAITIDNVILGTTGNDTLAGTVFNDPILAKSGNDNVTGNGGDDCVDLGNGNDTVTTLDGSDVILDGAGNDSINAGNGNNVIRAGNGNDNVRTGNGVDDIEVGGGNNTVESGGGGDRVVTGSGNDTICTGTFASFGNINTCTGGAEADNVNAGGGNNKVRAGDGANTINTESGNDEIVTGNGADVIDAGGGNNVIASGGGGDSVMTESGNDTICTGTFASFGNINTCTGGAEHDTVNAGNGNNKVRTGDGGDTITTGNGNDEVVTGSGADSIITNGGNDSIDCGAGTDVANSGSGNDTNVANRCETFS